MRGLEGCVYIYTLDGQIETERGAHTTPFPCVKSAEVKGNVIASGPFAYLDPHLDYPVRKEVHADPVRLHRDNVTRDFSNMVFLAQRDSICIHRTNVASHWTAGSSSCCRAGRLGHCAPMAYYITKPQANAHLRLPGK